MFVLKVKPWFDNCLFSFQAFKLIRILSIFLFLLLKVTELSLGSQNWTFLDKQLKKINQRPIAFISIKQTKYK